MNDYVMISNEERERMKADQRRDDVRNLVEELDADTVVLDDMIERLMKSREVPSLYIIDLIGKACALMKKEKTQRKEFLKNDGQGDI